MFSKEEERGKITNILPYLSGSGSKAVGSENTSRIFDPDDTYTDTKSTNPNQNLYAYMEYMESYSDKKDSGEGVAMEDNKLFEKYMDKIDRDQRELRDDMRERESRIEKQISDSEARENERMNRIEQLIQSQNDKIDALKDEVGKKLEDDKKYRHTNNIAIVLGVIATALTMVGIYYATVSMVTDIIGVAAK